MTQLVDSTKVLQRIKQMKEERGLSLEWMAREIGISVFTLQRILSGSTKAPNPSTLKLFSIFLKDYEKAKEKGKVEEFFTPKY